jgi:tRNA (cmo5U34)-methyltransferase
MAVVTPAKESSMARVGDDIETENAGWSFGGNVAEHFDEHVARSVPFYREGHELIARASDFFVSEGSVCYDLGCSTGQLLLTLADRHRRKAVRFVGIDVEPNMVAVARRKCVQPNIEVQQGDLLDVELERADVIVCYYVMQFIRPKNRQVAFDRVYQALNWGGAFFCFEKVRAPDARFQDITTALYQEYKLGQGYDATEIVEKSRSLKGILEPFSTEGNLGLLRRAGFVDVMTIFKYVCFEGFLAIK